DSINTLGQNWNDNRLRAYYKVDIDHIDGFMKFDLSSIPDAAVITSMTLTTYYEGPAYQNPNVRIYRVADDSWSRASTVDPHPGLDQVLTPAHTSFPDTPLAPYTWSLDVNAADWTLDLLDNVLSLGMRNENETYSYVYWCGSDPSPAPPELTVTFIVPPNTLVLTAQDTDSINTLGQNWNDNRLRAYYKVDIDHIDGFMKFITKVPRTRTRM
ncbi:MAG: DNRLRE domain-containing protein, partial [Planctomycetota bacterium]